MLYYCSLLIYLLNSIPFLCLYFWLLTMPRHYDPCFVIIYILSSMHDMAAIFPCLYLGDCSDVIPNVQGYEIQVREFDVRSCYYVRFRTNIFVKGMNSFIILAMGEIVPLLSFYNDA